jgi:hypothetical protein
MEVLLNFLIPILILVLLLRWMMRRIFSGDTLSDYVAHLLHDITLGVWHWIFGYPKRRMIRGKRCMRRRR